MNKVKDYRESRISDGEMETDQEKNRVIIDKV